MNANQRRRAMVHCTLVLGTTRVDLVGRLKRILVSEKKIRVCDAFYSLYDFKRIFFLSLQNCKNTRILR